MNTTATIKAGRVGLILALLPGAFTAHTTTTEAAPVAIAQQLDSADAPDVIFSNLGPAFLGRYTVDFYALPVAGRDASFYDEEWVAVAFTPMADCQVKVLQAAIGYVSGDRRVTLGVYTEENGTVGTLLPGGEGSTSQMPNETDCCQLARVTLPGAGVTLQGNTRYWLVASPDNVNAPTFTGKWHQSNRSLIDNYVPDYGGWLTGTGGWPAAQVRGRYIGNRAIQSARADNETTSFAKGVRSTLFSSLPITTEPPFSPTVGLSVTGSNVSSGEVWRAIPFTVKSDAHARTLAAGLGYVSGTRLVKIGVYSDNDGVVGTALSGGEGSTTDIPDLGECCKLTEIKLAGRGVTLSRNTPYWLVVSTDDVNAPDFNGNWLDSWAALGAYEQPGILKVWVTGFGPWLAAEIRGSVP